MTNKSTAVAVMLAAFARVDAPEAHHSISMFEIASPIWVKGTVVSYAPINPHAIIVLAETTSDGTVRRWTIEGPTLQRLERMNVGPDFILAGDSIEACGFPPRAEFSSQQPSLDTAAYLPQVLHGHVLLMADGQRRHWGPYGKIENCIRPDDDVQTWVDFVNTDPMARTAWCSSRTFVWAASLPPERFVADVGRRMADPCE